MNGPTTALALVDCNSFFCSCERLFRPDLKTRPVIVLSNNDGCVISRTPEAKALGIQMCAPYFQIQNFCQRHGVHIFSSNFALYTDISARVMQTLDTLAPEVEVYSIDEAFLNIAGIKDASELGQHVQSTVLRNVGIPVGVGIGPTKVLAKIANRLAKQSAKAKGVVNLLEPRLQDAALARTPIEEVWGIGRASTVKMHHLGIRTAKELRDFSNERLLSKTFSKVGVQIQQELRGIGCFPFNRDPSPKKEILCSRTLSTPLLDRTTLKEALANYITEAAAKMRAQGSSCQEITIFARTNPFNNGPQIYLHETSRLVSATANTLKLIATANQMVDRLFREGYHYKKAGVRLSDFYSSSYAQIDLFTPQDSQQEQTLMNVLDRINERQGALTIKSAACGLCSPAWQMNRNFKSPRYTTSWSELLRFG